jgi:dolichol-phosphate mannosyltransferase
MDADLSHRPADLPSLLRAAERVDVVVGSRSVTGGRTVSRSRWRNLLSTCGAGYARIVLRLPVRDATSGFNCLNRAALTVLCAAPLRATGYSFLVEIKYRCARAGLTFAEVPITFEDRRRGQSKMSRRIMWEGAVMVLRMRLERPGQGAS